MARKNIRRPEPKAPPKGSDAEKAGKLEGGGALPPDRIGDAEQNRDKVAAANERPTESSELELDEPGTIDALVGGAGALPNSLEPAADNARRAETASELQAEIAQRPENPNEVKREHLRKIAKYLGKAKTADVLGRYFGVSDPDTVGVHQLDIAIDELHKAAG